MSLRALMCCKCRSDCFRPVINPTPFECYYDANCAKELSRCIGCGTSMEKVSFDLFGFDLSHNKNNHTYLKELREELRQDGFAEEANRSDEELYKEAYDTMQELKMILSLSS